MTRIFDPEGAHLGSLRRLARFDGASVIEVGCGNGRLTAGLAEEAARLVRERCRTRRLRSTG